MFCPTVRPVNFYINVSVVSASQNLPPSIARTRSQRSELSTRRDFSSKAYQEEDTGPAAELYLSFSHINLRQLRVQSSSVETADWISRYLLLSHQALREPLSGTFLMAIAASPVLT